ncbi:uncharacterized protein LOC134837628 [Culicoides brevitarsis]|uniref:uncharacterized protein LOC134837628 n=1 Tax=Culicoides brevitarsis TaxID=469753 RepID=UPI00307B81A5
MDIVDIMQILGYVGVFIAGFILLFMQKGKPRICGHYTQPEWNFFLKRWYAQRIVRKIKENQHSLLKYEKNYDYENPKLLPSSKSSESQFIYGCDMNGNFLLLKFTRFQHRIAEIWLVLKFEDGTILTLPEHPDTLVCNGTPNKFEAHGLTLENLVPYSKWRIRFNGLLRRGIRTEFSEEIHESDLEYVKFNFLWNACSVPQHWPFDWSPKLMATAIALEPWRDGNWKNMLNKADSGGYDQFGALKGRVFIQKEKLNWNDALNSEKLEKNFTQIDLNLPGIRQRRWGPSKTSHLHRTASFVGVLQDGVVFECGAISSRTGLTHCQFGNFRTPTGKVFPIDWTDFHLSKFAENSEELPESATINLKANGRRFQLQVKFNTENCVPLMGGNPFNWIEYNVPFECTTYDGQKGCGMAMFWYPKRQEKFLHYRDFLRVKRVFYRHDIETQEF